MEQSKIIDTLDTYHASPIAGAKSDRIACDGEQWEGETPPEPTNTESTAAGGGRHRN